MNHTVYVKNVDLWERASKLAAKDGKSMSLLVHELLTRWVIEQEGVETITLQAHDGGGTWKFARQMAAAQGLTLDEYVERTLFNKVHEDMRID